GLAFRRAGILQQDRVDGEASDRLRHRAHCIVAKGASKDPEGYLPGIGFGGLIGTMAQFHMGDFVRHHTGHLSLIVGSLQNAAVDVTQATGANIRTTATTTATTCRRSLRICRSAPPLLGRLVWRR